MFTHDSFADQACLTLLLDGRTDDQVVLGHGVFELYGQIVPHLIQGPCQGASLSRSLLCNLDLPLKCSKHLILCLHVCAFERSCIHWTMVAASGDILIDPVCQGGVGLRRLPMPLHSAHCIEINAVV